jgi:hypothetical protein
MMQIMRAAAVLALAVGALAVFAQATSGASWGTRFTSPEALAEAVLTAFGHRDTSAFRQVYPFEPGRALLQSAIGDSVQAVPVFGKVLRRNDPWALLMLAGYLRYGNSGDETSTARRFSGLYLATSNRSGVWRLRGRLPLEEQGGLQSHRLVVDLQPGFGLAVVDSLIATVRDTNGLAVRLNHTAAVRGVFVSGQPAAYEFGGGVLWIDAPRADRLPVVISYRLDVARDSLGNPNSGRFTPMYGHVRNQYFWHPFLWFDDAAMFHITVTAPASAHVATDLDQTEVVRDERRVIEASTRDPTPALSLFYDTKWVPVHLRAGDFRFTVFATPDFKPAPDSLARAFERVVELLRARFGPPSGAYRAIVQQRARGVGTAGWPFMSNAVIAADWDGGPLADQAPRPRAYFGHEVAHAWTHPTGPGRTFLSEGWATFAESVILRDLFGAGVEHRFWKSERESYVRGNFDGRAQLTDDPHNSGVAYSKGAWVLRMLEDEIGQPAFDSGFRDYVAGARNGRAGVGRFLESMSRAAGRDVSAFMSPWLDGTSVPRIVATVEGSRLVVRQTQPGAPFQLALPVAIIAGSDTIRVTVHVEDRRASVDLPRPPTPGASVVVDPELRFLILQN